MTFLDQWKILETCFVGRWSARLTCNQTTEEHRAMIMLDGDLVGSIPIPSGPGATTRFHRAVRDFIQKQRASLSHLTVLSTKEEKPMDQPKPVVQTPLPAVVPSAPIATAPPVAVDAVSAPKKAKRRSPLTHLQVGRLTAWILANQQMLKNENKTLKAVAAMATRELKFVVRPHHIAEMQEATGVFWGQPRRQPGDESLSSAVIEAVVTLYIRMGETLPDRLREQLEKASL